jgi:hypothetical protein
LKALAETKDRPARQSHADAVTLERLEAEKKQKDFGEKITSWEASAKPNDSVS